MASRYPIRVQSRGRPFGKGRLWPLGGPALREPCRPKAVGGLELVCSAQGRVILAGSTFRREKMRLDPCTDRRPDAARASSRRLAGRHGRHWFLRWRELIVQLAVAQRSDQNFLGAPSVKSPPGGKGRISLIGLSG